MGHGTGVLWTYHALYVIRGLTVGIAGASCLFIAENTGLSQSLMVGSRGIGLAFGPIILCGLIGKMIWSGNAELMVGAACAIKVVCELAISRVDIAPIVYVAFCGIGLAQGLLDTAGTLLMTRVFGKKAAAPMAIYDIFYSVGCMVAPFIAVWDPLRAWDILASLDFLFAVMLVSKRVRRGKPRNWKAKVRGQPDAVPSDADRESGTTAPPPFKVPHRVVRIGVAFTFAVQVTMTSVSCWGFTYAVRSLQWQTTDAALIPSMFCAAGFICRLIIAGASSRFAVTSVIHNAALLCLFAAMGIPALGHCMTGALSTAVPSAWLALYRVTLIACFMLVGMGTAPHYAMMLAAMARHGELDSRVHGIYNTVASLGITVGIWAPGACGLPAVVLCGAIAMFLIINSHQCDFPRGSFLPGRRSTTAAQKKDAKSKMCVRWNPSTIFVGCSQPSTSEPPSGRDSTSTVSTNLSRGSRCSSPSMSDSGESQSMHGA